ncbi:MAG: hypothetical protein R3E79_13790 [Caldilineaceae bacterium]
MANAPASKRWDRLNIVAHDKFQEIVDEANRPDSLIRLEQVILEPSDNDTYRPSTVIASPTIATLLNGQTVATPAGNGVGANGNAGRTAPAPLFQTPAAQQIAQLTYQAIQRRETLPSVSYLQRDEVVQALVQEVREQYVVPSQHELPGIEAEPAPDFTAIVNQVVTQVQQLTIDIPRIVVVPKGEVTTGFHEFTLATSNVHYQPVARDLLIQSLQTNQQEALSMERGLRPKHGWKITWCAIRWTSPIFLMTITPICSMIWPVRWCATWKVIWPMKMRCSMYSSITNGGWPNLSTPKCRQTAGRRPPVSTPK